MDKYPLPSKSIHAPGFCAYFQHVRWYHQFLCFLHGPVLKSARLRQAKDSAGSPKPPVAGRQSSMHSCLVGGEEYFDRKEGLDRVPESCPDRGDI